MTKYADLHMHTHFSDGSSSPEEIIEDARSQGLCCIAITDHDTVAGVRPTQEAGKQYDIEVLSGVELSSETNGRDIHLLGYCLDCEDASFNERLSNMQATRVERMETMIEKLNGLGVHDVSLEEVLSLASDHSVGRPHLAQLMVKKGVVSSIKAAFDRYLAEGAPAYVAKYKLSTADAIELVHSAGGVAVLAHPMVTGVDEMIPHFVEAGLDGIEVYYPNCAANVVEFYEGIAKKHDLLMTGGSDAHGESKTNTFVGKVKIPYELVEQLKGAAKT